MWALAVVSLYRPSASDLPCGTLLAAIVLLGLLMVEQKYPCPASQFNVLRLVALMFPRPLPHCH